MKNIIFISLFLFCVTFSASDPIIIIHNDPSPSDILQQPKQTLSLPTISTKNIIELPDVSEKQAEEPETNISSVPKKTFTDNKMSCVLELPMSWEIDTTSVNYKLIAYPYNNDPITVKLKAYKATEKITANTVYLYRSGAVWDRWQLLASKKFTPKNCFLIGVTEKISGVYKKQDLTERLTLVNTIVAEDVYVKAPDLVYIVTAEAPEETWKQYSNTVKDIMNSFYVIEDPNGKKL